MICLFMGYLSINDVATCIVSVYMRYVSIYMYLFICLFMGYLSVIGIPTCLWFIHLSVVYLFISVHMWYIGLKDIYPSVVYLFNHVHLYMIYLFMGIFYFVVLLCMWYIILRDFCLHHYAIWISINFSSSHNLSLRIWFF